MNSGVNIKVPYVPLKKMSFRQSISTSTSNVINALTDFLRTVLINQYKSSIVLICINLSKICNDNVLYSFTESFYEFLFKNVLLTRLSLQ